jgi:hypothetical protein
MEQDKNEGFVDWVHRRLDEDESDSDLTSSKPSTPVTPGEPSDSSTCSPGVYGHFAETTNLVLRCSRECRMEP